MEALQKRLAHREQALEETRSRLSQLEKEALEPERLQADQRAAIEQAEEEFGQRAREAEAVAKNRAADLARLQEELKASQAQAEAMEQALRQQLGKAQG